MRPYSVVSKVAITAMLIALTGLHGCGKSSVGRILRLNHGFEVMDKRAVLLSMYRSSKSSVPFVDWYRSMYISEGGATVMSLIWKRFQEWATTTGRSNIVVDSVHNVDEWDYLRGISQASQLVYIVSSKETRTRRVGLEHLALDTNRVEYSHRCISGEIECLFALADASICNNYSEDVLEEEVRRLAVVAVVAEPPDI